jgi:transcriptional regulator with XRE-family HTH domain
LKVKLKDPQELKKLILQNGHSQRSFAEHIKVSNPYLNQILNEERFCSGKIAKQITDGLGMTFEEIFFIDDACNCKQTEESIESSTTY